MDKPLVLPIIRIEKCTLCGSCIEACHYSVLEIGSSGLSLIHPEQCTYCGECEEVCPESAIACPLEIIWAE